MQRLPYITHSILMVSLVSDCPRYHDGASRSTLKIFFAHSAVAWPLQGLSIDRERAYAFRPVNLSNTSTIPFDRETCYGMNSSTIWFFEPAQKALIPGALIRILLSRPIIRHISFKVTFLLSFILRPPPFMCRAIACTPLQLAWLRMDKSWWS